MSNGATALLPTTTLDDDAWGDLLSFIEERRVIPIVGPELLLVSTERGPRLLLDWVAEKLAGRLNVNIAELPQPYTLNDVVCWFLAARGRREEAYVRLRGIIKDANFEPPLALRRLAAITDFDLFVSTTFDSLLETAINLERFGGAPSTDVLSYAPNRVTDLPSERDRLHRPLVYHFFWSSSAPCRASTSHRRSCFTNSSTVTCCSSAAISRTGSLACFCAWRNANGYRIRATSAKYSQTITAARTIA
jgi:hypothetical protein